MVVLTQAAADAGVHSWLGRFAGTADFVGGNMAVGEIEDWGFDAKATAARKHVAQHMLALGWSAALDISKH